MTDEGAPSGVVVFFRNLPWETTAEEVKKAVSSKTNIDVDAKLSSRKDGRSRGYATARVSEEDAETLINLTPKIEFGEREMNIERRQRRVRKKKENTERKPAPVENGGEKKAGRPRRRRRNRNKEESGDKGGDAGGNGGESKDGTLLFFGNVPWDTTADDVQNMVESATGIKTDVKVSVRGNGRSRGYATARVPDHEAKQLMGLSESLSIGDRKIRIEQKKRRPRRRRGSGGEKEETNE